MRNLADDHEPRSDVRGLPISLFIPAVSPSLGTPNHLAPFTAALDGLPHSGRRLVVDAPVRHGKSTTAQHAVCKWLIDDPKLKFIYWTYGLKFAERQAKILRSLFLQAGGTIDRDRNTITDWSTPQGGGVFSTSEGGSITGIGADGLVGDDPIKNRAEAESAERRDDVDRALRDDAITRLTKDGFVLMIASRWHEDDPSGRMIRRGAEHVHLKAIQDDGTALWPEERPLEYLFRTREEIGEYGFASLYQGEPTPPASSLFAGAPTYMPDASLPSRVIIGVDLAYSKGGRADYSAMVVLLDFVTHYRIAKVVRGQWGLASVKQKLRQLRADYPLARMVSYVSGPEIGVLDLLLDDGILIERMPARFNKLVRAQRVSQAWSSTPSRVLVPHEAPWLDPFIGELRYFTGIDDAHDDQVDALVSAFDAAEGSRTIGWAADNGFLFGQRCM